LLDYLGAETVVWLGSGVVEDETDGHVDNLACFARPGVVLLTWPAGEGDPQLGVSADARRRLEAATDARGRSLEVVLVPAPGPISITVEEAAGVEPAPGTKPRRAGDRLAASYVNFYLAEGRVIMPLLDERCDEEAAEVLRSTFPEREVVGLPAHELLLGGGNIHCLTQQVPAI
jgi:agmatine deiminase